MHRALLVLAALLGLHAAACDPSALTDRPAPSPGTPGPAPDATAQAWLDAHNAVRAGTFPGVTVSPVPSPALPALGWSAPAAAVAQAWAQGCTYQHNPGRGPRGENIAAYSAVGAGTSGSVVGLWAEEWPDYDYAANACAAGKVCGHYTQLVWRTTTAVGCARATCAGGSPPAGWTGAWEYWVCNYEPPGNWVGERPY
jgi:hypothetical protein